MKALIGTKNPGKVQGAQEVVDTFFEGSIVEGVKVPSGVGEQPVNEEIYIGARNRVDALMAYAAENNVDADYFMAVESGIANLYGRWVIINIAVIKDRSGYESWGTSSAFPVPDKYVQEIIDTDLTQVMERILHEHDLRSSVGGVSMLTHDAITRIDMTKQAFTMAFTQFINNELWKDVPNSR